MTFRHRKFGDAVVTWTGAEVEQGTEGRAVAGEG